MVVTAGTGDGQAQEGLAEDIQLVVHAIRFVGQHVGRGVCRLVQVPETGANHGFIERLVRVSARIRQQIAGDMFAHEIVVGQVHIERPYQVITILIGVGDRVVKFVAAGFRVADEIHPMPRPLFTEVR